MRLSLVRYPRVAAAIALAVGIIATSQAGAQDGREIGITIAGDKLSGDALELSGGVPVVRVAKGKAIALRWRSDLPAILHLHGYDVETQVRPGEVASMRFDARAAGRFAIERHGTDGRHVTLLYVEVRP